MIEADNKIRTKTIAEKLNVSVRTVKRYIKGMKEIRYIGSGQHGYWQIDNANDANK